MSTSAIMSQKQVCFYYFATRNVSTKCVTPVRHCTIQDCDSLQGKQFPKHVATKIDK